LAFTADFSSSQSGLSATLSDQSTGAIDAITWHFGDGTSQTTAPGSSITHQYPGPSSYQVCLTATDSLGDGDVCETTECRLLTFTDSATTISPAANPLGLTVMPNPGQDYLRLQQATAQPLTVVIFDALGRPVWRGSLTREDTRIETAAWATGLYLLRVQGQAGQQAVRWWKR
jgi:hypothetical protein